MTSFLAPEDSVLKEGKDTGAFVLVVVIIWTLVALTPPTKEHGVFEPEIAKRVVKLTPDLFNRKMWIQSFMWTTLAVRTVATVVFAGFAAEFLSAITRVEDFSWPYKYIGYILNVVAMRCAVDQLDVYRTYNFTYGVVLCTFGVLNWLAFIASLLSEIIPIEEFRGWFWPTLLLTLFILGYQVYMLDLWVRCYHCYWYGPPLAPPLTPHAPPPPTDKPKDAKTKKDD